MNMFEGVLSDFDLETIRIPNWNEVVGKHNR